MLGFAKIPSVLRAEPRKVAILFMLFQFGSKSLTLVPQQNLDGRYHLCAVIEWLCVCCGIMDVWTSSICSSYLDRHLDKVWTLSALQKALVEHRPEMHSSHRGFHYAALAYTGG